MKIGIEAQRIFRKNKHGMDYVVLQEIKELQQIDTENEYYVFVKPGEDHCVESSKNVHIIELHCPTYPLWEQWALPKAAKKHGIEILHCTSNTAPIWCDVPLILTLHDIIYLEPRDRRLQKLSRYQDLGRTYRRFVVPRIIMNCKRIITVSNFERNNIIEYFHLDTKNITMLYNSYDEAFCIQNNWKRDISKHIDNFGYFLILGNTDYRKNTERMIIAYANYLKLSKFKRKLLVTSLTKEYINSILIDNKIESIREQIVLTDYLPFVDLPSIYHHAFCFLFASLREGFGIPILESMACGTPVITSNTSSMPEVAGSDAILVNPEKADEITEMMIRLENDNDFYERQKTVGLERIKLFSWRKTADNLLKIYQEVYQETMDKRKK
jgi:glycosyltransferase involved in cell wall biosynthesis